MGKLWELKLVFGSVVNMIYLKCFSFLYRFICIFTEKRWKTRIFILKWLDLMLLMTSYLIIVATD